MPRALTPSPRASATAFWPVFDIGPVRVARNSALAFVTVLPFILGGFATVAGWDALQTVTWAGLLATALAVAIVITLVALVLTLRAERASLASSLDQATAAIEALAHGDYTRPFRDSGDARDTALALTLGRLGRQLRENTETARQLANGSFRTAARSAGARDPIGVALAQVARSMEDIALSAQRVARGDLTPATDPRSDDDALGQAHAAMMHRVASTVRDADASVRRLMEEVDDLRSDAAALATAVDADTDRLRHALDRVTYVAIQARSDADRGAALAEQVVDSELLLDDGAAALQLASEGLRDVLGRAESVQRLARQAGLLAVYSSADAAQGAAGQRGVLPLESEARALAQEASSVATSLTRMMIDGTEHVHASGVALDNVTLALRKGTAMAREIGVTVRRHATELLNADERLVQLHGAMTRNASDARRLSNRLEMLSSRVRQQDAVLRRLDRGRTPLPDISPAPFTPTRPALYRTPPHAHVALPLLAMARA